MRTFTSAFIVVVACLVSGCSDSTALVTTTGPTSVSAELAAFSASAGAVFSQQMGRTSCPTVPPFVIPINLVVRVDGGINVFVTTVSMQFVDTTGIVMPQVTLPAPQMTTQFGTALVQARSARTFPLTLPVGCGTDKKGTVTLIVTTRDDQGRQQSGNLSVKVD
jgi:hypothetical protein